MFVYLAHPIDQAHGSSPLKRILHHVTQQLTYQGMSAFRPGRAYHLSLAYQSKASSIAFPVPEHMEKIDAINQNAIWESDAVIAVLPGAMPTLGVPAEIEHALKLNRPTLIVTTELLARSSVQIQAWVRRGARVAYVDTVMGDFIDKPNLAELLGELPDPTGLVLDEEPTTGPLPLLVSGETEHLTQGKYEGDAGLDLAIDNEVMLAKGEYALVNTGVHVAIPNGYFGLITGRSSTWAKYRCRIIQAIIDSGYRGELKVGIEATEDDVHFERGMRLAQLILLPTFQGAVLGVASLPEHERGHAGYGSSGK
jgi:dUTP diphosphatase